MMRGRLPIASDVCMSILFHPVLEVLYLLESLLGRPLRSRLAQPLPLMRHHNIFSARCLPNHVISPYLTINTINVWKNVKKNW